MSNRIRYLTAAIPIAMGLVAAGCGGSPSKSASSTSTSSANTSSSSTDSTSTTAPTLSLADLAKRYQDTVAPANTAGATFQTKLSQLGDNPSSADLGKIADPLAKVFQGMDETLLRLPWPDKIKPDVNSVVTADAVLEADLGSASAQNIFSAAAFVQQFTGDAAKVHAAVSILRVDLGLPPAAQ